LNEQEIAQVGLAYGFVSARAEDQQLYLATYLPVESQNLAVA